MYMVFWWVFTRGSLGGKDLYNQCLTVLKYGVACCKIDIERTLVVVLSTLTYV